MHTIWRFYWKIYQAQRLRIKHYWHFNIFFFLLECEPGTFGIDCALTCGRCSGNGSCDHETGYCTNGCRDGWLGTKCNRSKYIDLAYIGLSQFKVRLIAEEC